jgi:excisionase family DNA binding protein
MQRAYGGKMMTSMALTVNEACATARMGRTKLYEAINSGALPAKKHGKRTLILTADLHRWLDTLEHLDTWCRLPSRKPGSKARAFGGSAPKTLAAIARKTFRFHRLGIRDFGQEWGEDVGYTPIKLVQNFFCSVAADGKLELADFDENCAPRGSLSRDGAATWLCSQLGLDWNELKTEDVERAFAEPPPPEYLDASDPIREAQKVERRAKRPTVRFFDELGHTAEAPDFVEGVICDGQLSVVYGESGVGKTFIVSHLAMCVALGWQWRGRDVERGGVIYIAGEGAAGLEHRIAAFRQHHGMDTTMDAQFAIIPAAVDFRDKIAVEEIISAVKEAADRLGGRVRLIVIDTLSVPWRVGTKTPRRTWARWSVPPIAFALRRARTCRSFTTAGRMTPRVRAVTACCGRQSIRRSRSSARKAA